MTTWVQRFAPAPDGAIRVAVKDAIDMAGVVTTAGCAAVRDRAAPAVADAACLAGVRASDAVIVGKTTLSELCLSPSGVNAALGTPVNPIAPGRVPGGSSSGSAVAVASGQADVALGTDTGGSVRIPAACCGIVGLKTTWGRIPGAGVWPLARSLDTVGPLGRTVADVIDGMRLLAPDWAPGIAAAGRVGRLRIDGVDPRYEDLVDAALDAAGLSVRPVRLPGWLTTGDAFGSIVVGELWRDHHALLDVPGVGGPARDALLAGREVGEAELTAAMQVRERWRAEVAALLTEVDVLALPTLVAPPPPLTGYRGFPFTALTMPFNLAGGPALAMPVPSPGLDVPASLQLAGPAGGEELLCATAQAIEDAASHADPSGSRPPIR